MECGIYSAKIQIHVSVFPDQLLTLARGAFALKINDHRDSEANSMACEISEGEIKRVP